MTHPQTSLLCARLLAILFIFFSLLLVSYAQSDDQVICNRVFSFAFEHKLIEKPIGDIVVEVGKQFLGSPYEPNTLDGSDGEELVINLRGFDCVTFVENVVVLARCIKSNRLTYDAYKEELKKIRYRNGTINGYSSRLHYFSEWICDNEKKRILEDVTNKLGGIPYEKKIDFMTTHWSLYPKLSVDSVFMKMKVIEDSLTSHKQIFIPKSHIGHLTSRLHNGDIIAITTSTEGLDISHVGIAVRMKDGSLHYRHAPDVKGKVKISEETLDKYIHKHPSQTGIMVGRVSQ